MQALLRANLLARLVLAWFVLAVGVAVAAPVLRPVGLELICSAGGGAHLLDSGGPAHPGQAQPGPMDCPLCLPFAAPPPAVLHLPEPVPALAQAAQPIPAARIAALTGAPLPPRGPPAA